MAGRECGFDLTVVGGGLAGCEAAWQAAKRGLRVLVYEMRPRVTTGAHRTDNLAELVCSNSLGSLLPDRAGGVLKEELESLDSLLMRCAQEAAVPAGAALAVDREVFSARVSGALAGQHRIAVRREEVTEIPDGPAIIATGPLTSPALSAAIDRLTGTGRLFFYDAIAPIVEADSIDRSVVFADSRNGPAGDYLNCPLDETEYQRFVDALLAAERIPLAPFEEDIPGGVAAGAGRFFEGCLPVEVLAGRGRETLAFGTMRAIGLHDPRTGSRPYAVVQLRRENAAQTLFNLVGFQTNLREGDQRRVFRMIPGLEQAEFIRYGRMHRNTFMNAPRLLLPSLQYRGRADLLFAGQITGAEGYVSNIGTGLLAGWNAARFAAGREAVVLPGDTLLGGLCAYLAGAEEKYFQPMKANFGLLPPLEGRVRGKLERQKAYAARARAAFQSWRETADLS